MRYALVPPSVASARTMHGVERRFFQPMTWTAEDPVALTDSQRKKLEQRLRDERDRSLRTLNRSLDENSAESEEDQAGDLTKMPTHQADLGTDTMQEELDASNATRISRQLAEIDAALERLYADPERFGICEQTGKPIPYARLEIIPWARTCGEESTG